MPKKYKTNKIRQKRSYSFSEIADLMSIHVRTVQSWKKVGLKTIEGTRNPYLVMGYDLKEFLKKEQSKRKTKLKGNEIYCLVCRKGVVCPDVSEQINGIVGGSKLSVLLKGTCPFCGNAVNKFASKEGST